MWAGRAGKTVFFQSFAYKVRDRSVGVEGREAGFLVFAYEVRAENDGWGGGRGRELFLRH